MKLKNLFCAVALSALAVTGWAQGGEKDIVDTAVGAGHFTTLAKLLTKAGLVDTLKGTGPFTVFAPTDAAFAKLPKKLVAKLMDDSALLKKVLLYHVVSGSVKAADVVKLKKATTVEGGDVHIKVKHGSVYLNKSKVIKADVLASNGVIHVIDTVLIPK